MANWGNEYMNNQYGMSTMQPMSVMPEMGAISINPAPALDGPPPLIGPVMPEGYKTVSEQNKNGEESDKQRHHHSRTNSNRDRNRKSSRDRNSDRDRRRSRSRNRYRRSRDDANDRNHRNDRSSRRDKPSKWSKEEDENQPGLGDSMNINNMPMMPGMNMMPYNMMNNNMMVQQPMEMGNMQNMGVMQNAMSMMDPSMMMVNNQMMMPQPIALSVGLLLPPIPGIVLPNRREKPLGCRTIFVGGLPNTILEDVISEIFMRFGTITSVKLHRQGVCHVRFQTDLGVEQSFCISGYRFKLNEQLENEATTIFIDYALNRDDQNEYERNLRIGVNTPPRIEPFSSAALSNVSEKISTDEGFIDAAPTLLGWLERGECNKKCANQFYTLIQATNNQVRRLFTEKMQLDEQYQALKVAMRDKYASVIMQFEQVAKILTAAKHQRVSDHFSKQQRRNIEMWLKMTEEVENIKEEFDSYFNDDTEKVTKNGVPLEKYEELRKQNENLNFELEGYKNEAYLAKDEAERKFEKFKAHFIAQQALMNPKQVYPPLPPPPMPSMMPMARPEPPPPTPDEMKARNSELSNIDAKLISVLTAFLLIHPLGASLEYIMSYVRSILPRAEQGTVSQVLYRYPDIFRCKSTGIGPNIEHKWQFVTFEEIKCN